MMLSYKYNTENNTSTSGFQLETLKLKQDVVSTLYRHDKTSLPKIKKTKLDQEREHLKIVEQIYK